MKVPAYFGRLDSRVGPRDSSAVQLVESGTETEVTPGHGRLAVGQILSISMPETVNTHQ